MRQLDVDVFDGEFGFREEPALSFGMSQAAGRLSFQGPPEVMESWQGKTSRFDDQCGEGSVVGLRPEAVRMSHHASTDRPSVTIPSLQQRVRDGQRLVMTTAYDAVTARLADPIVDMILVGDSVGNVCLGFDNTLPVSMAMMNHHLEAVMRTRPRALVVADMPYLSYHLSLDDTLCNAGGFLQRGAAAVKLEGGAKRAETSRPSWNARSRSWAISA